MSRASRYIAHTFGLLRTHYVFGDRVNWPALRARALAGAAHAADEAQTHPALRAAIAELGDPHTRLLTPGRRRTPPPAALPGGYPLGPDLACLVLPPVVEVNDPAGYVASAAALVRHLDSAHPRGWVVDLRGGGGESRPDAAWTVLAALAPLLGEGLVGGSVKVDGRQSGWVIHRGQIYLDGAPVGPYVNDHLCWWPDLPVAVLTGPDTAGPAEAAVVAFRGHAWSRSFGAPTRGLATGVTDFALPDGAGLRVTTDLFLGRDGAVLGTGPIPPDERTAPAERGGDPALRAAVVWLHATTRGHS